MPAHSGAANSPGAGGQGGTKVAPAAPQTGASRLMGSRQMQKDTRSSPQSAAAGQAGRASDAAG